MFHRNGLLIVLILASASPGFSQTIADRARSERARRDALPESATSPDPGAMPVGREVLMEEALRASGARRQLEQILENALQSANGKPPEGVSPQDYQRIITEAFDADRLMQVMETSISSAVSDETLVGVVQWYRSPLGRKIASADVNANGPAASAQMQRYASTLQGNPPSPSRMRLVQQLEEQTQATENTVRMLLSVVMSIYKGITAAGTVVSPPPADFDRTFRAQVTEPLHQAMILWFLFAYNSVTEPELAGYLTFLKSPPSVAFNNSIWTGMNAAFGDAAQHLGQKLAEQKRRASPPSR